MSHREYIRICKKDSCQDEFVVSAPSLDGDRAIGFSEPEYCPKHRQMQVKAYSRIACHHFDMKMTPEGEELVRKVERELALASTERDGEDFDPWDTEKGYGPGGIGRFQRKIRSFRPVEGLEPWTEEQRFQKFELAKKGDELMAKLEKHQVVVLVGTTGSGKSTYIPWFLLTGGKPGELSKWAKRGPICITQPRVVAAENIPKFISRSINGTTLGAGGQIGYSHSDTDAFDRRTRLIFKTDGKLINEILSGAIANYSLIMIDEAHERSTNIDLILGLLRDQLYLYPHLRVIIASATINEAAFLEYYGLNKNKNDHYVFSEGRVHAIRKHWWGETHDAWKEKEALLPVKERWNLTEGGGSRLTEWWKNVNSGDPPGRTNEGLPRAVADTVLHICNWLDSLPPAQREIENGHILVFLTGVLEIEQTVALINSLNLKDTVALPLLASLSQSEQDAAIDPEPGRHPHVYGKRRVVVSTNVAETSLTVEDVKHVIDAGYIKESCWNGGTEISELRVKRHSQAGCKQRWGRAGRICSGHVYMLYSEEDFSDFATDSSPGIAMSSMEEVILKAKMAGVKNKRGIKDGKLALDFAWLPLSEEQQPDFERELIRAFRKLQENGALDIKDGDLTEYGVELCGTRVSPYVSNILKVADLHGLGTEAACVVPFLTMESGWQRLFQWDPERLSLNPELHWDVYDKQKARLAHLDLAFGCQDDLDLALKMSVLLEAFPKGRRGKFLEEYYLDAKQLSTLCESQDTIRNAISDWKKSESRECRIEYAAALREVIFQTMAAEAYQTLDDWFLSKNVTPLNLARRVGDDAFEAPDGMEMESAITLDSPRNGVCIRLAATQVSDSSLIEMATSSLARRSPAKAVVFCSKGKNFLRSPRAKILGYGAVVCPEARAPSQSSVEFAIRVGASKRETNYHESLLKFFLPWIVPRNTICSVGMSIPMENGKHRVVFKVRLPDWLGDGEMECQGVLNTSLGTGEIQATATGYVLRNGLAYVEMEAVAEQINESAPQHVLRDMRKRQKVQAQLKTLLPDPFGRALVYVASLRGTAFTFPMAEEEFSGGTQFHRYMADQFELGQQFEVSISDLFPKKGLFYASRGPQVLTAYLNVVGSGGSIVHATIKRCSGVGVHLDYGNCPLFVPSSLWPAEEEWEPVIGRRIEGRLRCLEWSAKPEKLSEILKRGDVDLPPEFNLGVDFDVLSPRGYDLLTENYEEGDSLDAVIERIYDEKILVRLPQGLNCNIYRSELGLDQNGGLMRPSGYKAGSSLQVYIHRLHRTRKLVNLSLLRSAGIPPGLERGAVIEFAVLLTERRSLRGAPSLVITGSYFQKYGVKVTLPDGDYPDIRRGAILRGSVSGLKNGVIEALLS